MKKTFIIEVEYDELEENLKNNTEVFNDLALEIGIENLMEAYKQTGSIQSGYIVQVKKLTELQELREENNRLNERLQISACGDDKIDELECTIEHLRFQLNNK